MTTQVGSAMRTAGRRHNPVEAPIRVTGLVKRFGTVTALDGSRPRSAPERSMGSSVPTAPVRPRPSAPSLAFTTRPPAT